MGERADDPAGRWVGPSGGVDGSGRGDSLIWAREDSPMGWDADAAAIVLSPIWLRGAHERVGLQYGRHGVSGFSREGMTMSDASEQTKAVARVGYPRTHHPWQDDGTRAGGANSLCTYDLSATCIEGCALRGPPGQRPMTGGPQEPLPT